MGAYVRARKSAPGTIASLYATASDYNIKEAIDNHIDTIEKNTYCMLE
jgi:hypothetical protein